MKLSQKNILRIILVVVVALYNFILFMVTSDVEKTEVFWVSYGFIMLAPVLLLILTVFPLSFTDGTELVFSMPTYKVIITYCGAEFLVGTLFMFLQAQASVKVALLVQIPLLIVFVIIFFVILFGAMHVSQNYQKQKQNVFNMNMIQLRINTVAASTSSSALSGKLRAVAEKVKYSDFNSYPENKDVEDEIKITVSSLEDAVTEDVAMELAVKLDRLIERRRAACQYIKKMRG